MVDIERVMVGRRRGLGRHLEDHGDLGGYDLGCGHYRLAGLRLLLRPELGRYPVAESLDVPGRGGQLIGHGVDNGLKPCLARSELNVHFPDPRFHCGRLRCQFVHPFRQAGML